MTNKPIWITIDGGDLFEGHQLHWADTFFSNATVAEIRDFLETDSSLAGATVRVREMTPEEVESHPGLKDFLQGLLDEYGEI